MKKRKRQRKVHHVEQWEPRRGKDRPTRERLSRGQWTLQETEDAGIRAAVDVSAHPIDALEHRGVLSSDQASAGRSFEALYRAQSEVGGIRDSCTIWEPKGHDESDGPVEQREAYRELCRQIGLLRERRLYWVCVAHNEPSPSEIGQLREDLNECVRFFKW